MLSAFYSLFRPVFQVLLMPASSRQSVCATQAARANGAHRLLAVATCCARAVILRSRGNHL
jgi:hypothetical protein